MNFTYVPGSVIKAKSPWPLPDHFGIAGWPLPDGTMTVIDATEVGVQVRTISQFAAGREVEFRWIPVTADQQKTALSRAYSQIGHAYELFHANCEHLVYWVVTGEAESLQLRSYVAVLGLVGLGAWLYSNKGRP